MKGANRNTDVEIHREVNQWWHFYKARASFWGIGLALPLVPVHTLAALGFACEVTNTCTCFSPAALNTCAPPRWERTMTMAMARWGMAACELKEPSQLWALVKHQSERKNAFSTLNHMWSTHDHMDKLAEILHEDSKILIKTANCQIKAGRRMVILRGTTYLWYCCTA